MEPKKSILDTAIRTIRIEADALEALAVSIGATPDFEACVDMIIRMSGRVVVTGIGKSAIVAQKIVATLNSTGQPALFLHAADAIHGDLGMVQPSDLVICISKSGETPEIKVLLPILRQLGNRIVAMTAQSTSYLARHADYVLLTPIKQEADPNGLAPTTSTTVQMALGDALAVTLLAQRGFSSADFARYHPGGTLGKQLYLRVGDLYTLHGRPIVRPDTLLPEVLLVMTADRLGATAVLDAQDVLVGIITDGDLRRMLSRDTSATSYRLCAQDVMTKRPSCIHPEALAVEALELMRERSITQLVVVDHAQHYLGMIHLHDLIREGVV
jgi:arabinose-5-phosphate isomerase